MKKIASLLIFIFIVLCVIPASSSLSYDTNIFNRLRPSEGDIPEGFIFGKIPGFAQKVLKDNPWQLDGNAIRKLADRIYPDGDPNAIQDIHMTIMTTREKPYSDDIVCYIILFKNGKSAKTELEKLSTFSGYNGDRTILLAKDNLAVFLLVDDVDNFQHIRHMADGIETKLKEL